MDLATDTTLIFLLSEITSTARPRWLLPNHLTHALVILMFWGVYTPPLYVSENPMSFLWKKPKQKLAIRIPPCPWLLRHSRCRPRHITRNPKCECKLARVKRPPTNWGLTLIFFWVTRITTSTIFLSKTSSHYHTAVSTSLSPSASQQTDSLPPLGPAR